MFYLTLLKNENPKVSTDIGISLLNITIGELFPPSNEESTVICIIFILCFL